MIVRMSKVEIVGPKILLQKVLSLLQESGIFQIDPATIRIIEHGAEARIGSFLPDEKTLSERLFFEGLRVKLDELFSYLPHTAVRKSYIEPLSIIDAVAKTVEKHISFCRDLHKKRDSLQKEMTELSRYAVFLGAIEPLLGGLKETDNIDIIGLTIRDLEAVEYLRELISRLTGGRFEFITSTAEDGTLVGLITTEKAVSDKVKRSLSDEHIPELSFPPSLSGLTFTEKITYLRKRFSEVNHEVESMNREIGTFSQRWEPIYRRVNEWIDEKLSLLKAAASVFETRMCFYIHGWMPSGDVKKLGNQLSDAFAGKVVLMEKEMHEEDLEMVPVVLKNPAYFRPFELFTRLLPLPKYTSFDPTPFIGIFFPIFFGMILGDSGYGLILLIISLVMIRRFRGNKNIHDAARILRISSIYAVFFGILYGEFIGELPHILFGLEPLCIERRTAVIPMLYFSVTVGIVHIMLGFFLGFISALKREKKEAFVKLLNMFIILCIIALVASFFEPFRWIITRPVIIVILILTPILFFTGGLLAPFELLKGIGNIISYARIMAIGLTSVLLAFVANRLGGMTGDIVIGIFVAGLLHILNIILGVFSTTIHSMRLHYVEFFSKFLEHGGKRFEPLRK